MACLGNLSDTPKLSYCAWQGTFWEIATDVKVRFSEEKTSCFCTFPGFSFLLHPDATEDLNIHFFVYNTPSRVNAHLMFLSFVKFDSRLQSGSSLTLRRPLRKCLCYAQTWALSIAALPYNPRSIWNMYEKDMFSKTQNVMFLRCSVTDIFKCDEPTIRRNKQTTDS
jgi:hypothetical protein